MRTIDLDSIKEIITKKEPNEHLHKSLSVEEKFIAIEQILKNYKEMKPKIPKLREEKIEKQIQLARHSNEKDFSKAMDNLNRRVEEIRKLSDEDIYILYMIEECSYRYITICVEIDQIGQNLALLRDKIIKEETHDGIVKTGQEIDELSRKLDEKIRDSHVAQIMSYFFETIYL